MQKHLELVGLLFVIAAAISALAATAILILGVGALSIGWSADAGVAASLTAAAFIVISALLLLWALAHAWVGSELRRRHRSLARLTALALAMLQLFIVPFGTALGVYSLWVLLHPETRGRFEGREHA
jgi:hypothetical protein